MSTYYNFYAAKKNKDGMYEFIGPYLKNKDGELKIEPFFWRSRSFINFDEFDPYPIPVDEMTDEVKEMCTEECFSFFPERNEEENKEKSEEEQYYSIGYWIPYDKLSSLASDEPIRGFLPVDEAAALIASKYDSEYIEWGLESTPIPAEVMVGMTEEKRSEYSFVSYVNRSSTAYQAHFIFHALSEYEDWQRIEDEETYGVIVQVD